MKFSVFHIDDDLQTLQHYSHLLTRKIDDHNFVVQSFSTLDQLISQLHAKSIVDAFIIDLYLNEGSESGISAIKECRKLYPKALILAASSTHDLELIHASFANGADDFIPKDLPADDIFQLITNKIAGKTAAMTIESQKSEICGDVAKQIRNRAPQIITSAVNCVHVFGETGTGKELIADIFADLLPDHAPMIRVNCGAIAPSLMLSEMFGHCKGAFTGALREKIGLLEAADGGWIFLDEISTLTLEAQAALLRAIDYQKIRRIGSTKDIAVSFRILSAANEPLEDLVECGRFRRDLWQRLRETEITLPPLRSRKNELPELIEHFCRSMRGGPYTLAPTVMSALTKYDWHQGNIRELRNCLRSMTETATNKILTPQCIPERIWSKIFETSGDNASNRSTAEADTLKKSFVITWDAKEKPTFEDLCNKLLLQMVKAEQLRSAKISMRALARACGVPKSTMTAKIKKLVTTGFVCHEEFDDIVKA